MATRGIKSVSSFGLVLFFLFALHAEATQQETSFVSGTGSDSNPCTRALPCQTLYQALAQTFAGGKIYVLDALDTNEAVVGIPLTISQSVSIIGAGARNSISGGVIVEPGSGGQVLLKGLDINGLGGYGVTVEGGGFSLVIDDCTIVNGTNGIAFTPSGTASTSLVVRNSIISYNTAGASGGTNAGILIQPLSTGGQAVVVIENTNVNNNNFGIRAFDNSVVTVRNSVATENVNAGIRAEQTATPAVAVSLLVEHSQASNNHSGVVAIGATAVVRITDVTITDNGSSGVSYASGGTVCSFGNNSIVGNPTTSTPTSCPLS